MFLEFPEDSAAWLIEDQYMLGENMLVAPLFEENTRERNVYVPQGTFVDYQTGQEYEGGKWYKVQVGEIPIVILAKKGASIKTASVCQHTGEIDLE